MKGGNKLFLIAGVGLAVVAIALLASSMLGGGDKADAQKETKVEQATVVQAAIDIPAHTLLRQEDLIEVQVPITDVPPDAVTSKLAIAGLSYRVPLTQGQVLLSAQTEQPGIRNDIEAGKRAFSLPVDDVSMLSGLVQQDDYVDVVFHARVDLVRSLPTNFAEIPEDYQDYKIGGGNSSGDGNSDSNSGSDENNEETDVSSETSAGPIVWWPAGLEIEIHPAVGDPGSQFQIRDSGYLVEPVAKILIQDVKILRVVRPGESYAANGTLAGAPLVDGQAAPVDEGALGYLILQVTPAQAEALTFMQDQEHLHDYQVMVRGKDDHAQVETTGITFEILATEEPWSMPWPETVTAPDLEDDALLEEEEE